MSETQEIKASVRKSKPPKTVARLSRLALARSGASCGSDRDIVLAAVSQDGASLQHAAGGCQSDREIVL
eukprot:527405-Amphidinium_carterae.1